MKNIIIVIILFILGTVLFAIGKYFNVKSGNKRSITQDLTDFEKKEKEVNNLNFSHFISLVGVVLDAIAAIGAIFSMLTLMVTQPIDDGADDKVTTSIIQIEKNTKVSTENDTYLNIDTDKDESLSIVQENTSCVVTEEDGTADLYSTENTITSDCVLEDEFSKDSTKKYYVLKSKYNSEYGFICSIDNVNLSYKVSIEDDKGEVLYDFIIPDDRGKYALELNKNSIYYIIIEAEEGYPKFSINLKYPDNDNY